jgi:hypothetical protein
MVASMEIWNDITAKGCTLNQVKEAGQQELNDSEKISPCSKHFQYIATMSSFKDEYFRKTISDEIQENPNRSWKAFTSLSLDSV